ncbi:hypothetical protein Baya_15305 [Bagarius yarrelli]|uniref:Fibrous sheath-interacting protein 2 n=1 Tax=Bagarius yarrelli TaxID=175774 RepID=A0A556VU16_BAGYA|nr:hypothetical protein Baya_15305 [Bagarius yarrelli]
MNERKRSNQSGTSGASAQNSTSGQRPKCFRDILNVVLNLTDKLEFAAACTKIVTSVSSAVVRRLLKPLSRSFGIKAILEANNRLKSTESKSDASDASADSSQASEFICNLGQRIVTEIKGAMLEAIRRTASQTRSPAEAVMSQLEDLSVACTNEICEKILALYHSEERDRPEEEKTSEASLKSHQEVDGIMKSLEQVVSISRSSSCCTVSSAADLVLTTTEKLAVSLSLQTSFPVGSETNLKFMTELANSTATEILQKLFYILVQSLQEHFSSVSRSDAEQSGAEREQKFLSEAQKIHTDIHKQVFRFFRKRQQAVSEKSQTLLDVPPEASTEGDVKVNNVQKPDAAKKFLDQGTWVASDVLVKRLNSQISTGSVSVGHSDSEAMPQSKASVDLDQVVSDNVNKLLSEEIEESDMETELEDRLTDEKSERKPSVQSSLFAPLHLFNVVRNQMKAFVSSFRRSADDEKTEASLESTVSLTQEPTKRYFGRSFSDSVLERGNRTLHAIQFPSELIYTFVEESTKGLLQNVLNTSSSDGGDGNASPAAEDQENKMSKTRYVVKTDRRLVVKNFNSSIRQKKQNGVPPSDESNVRTSPRLLRSSYRGLDASPSVFRNACKTLGRMFSVSLTPGRPSPESDPQ